MKRLIVILLTAGIFLSILPSPLSVHASEEKERYAVAAQEGVWFYAAENEESGLFQIPYTYYVRVLREGTLFTAVRYLDDAAPYRAVTGFCKTEDLTFVDFIPTRPYLRREITVVYNIAGEALMGGGSFDKLEKTFVYYGTSYSGTARFYYVMADGIFDYIPATQEIIFELNTDYLAPSVETAPPAPATSAPSARQVIVICAVGVALIAMAALVLRGKRPAPAEEF